MDAVAMELAAARHGCKVCGKSFSSGRSLGGHMRSHLSLGDAAAAAEGDAAADEVTRASGNGGRSSSNGGVQLGYGLRENPRKTRRLSDFAGDEEEETDVGDGDGDGEHNKACRECGKLFPSWKSLSGHMRSHASGGGRDRDDEEEYMDDVEEEFVPEEVEAAEEAAEIVEMAMEASVLAPALAAAPRRRRRTMRVAAPPPGSPAPVLSGFEKEPEDVALCLLMLSRDTGGLWSTPPPVKEAKPFNSARKRAGLPRSGFAYNSDDYSGKGRIRKVRKRSPPKQQQLDGVAPKKTRYECPGCGKVFTSYQALGGHRAGHKRINTSCSAPKVAAAASEPSTETYTASFSTMSPSASPDSVAIGFGNNPNAHQAAAVEKFERSSAQALGGHKRTHLIPADDGELYAREAADDGFLDLNFPAVSLDEA
ncbi:hypothetical protein HU200_051826 [Digitaria exilis]|uniref:C2H2-type domain-containing protein n=1 Tax=Digitaria exilis TaxID=1010633 RepID=A0A835ALL0_9POAL|nr:hypothetical protein HU200_051826 [Digitaria exilis]CAB3454855.1 unnamed protein product [Digitaria exilis]